MTIGACRSSSPNLRSRKQKLQYDRCPEEPNPSSHAKPPLAMIPHNSISRPLGCKGFP